MSTSGLDGHAAAEHEPGADSLTGMSRVVVSTTLGDDKACDLTPGAFRSIERYLQPASVRDGPPTSTPRSSTRVDGP